MTAQDRKTQAHNNPSLVMTNRSFLLQNHTKYRFLLALRMMLCKDLTQPFKKGINLLRSRQDLKQWGCLRTHLGMEHTHNPVNVLNLTFPFQPAKVDNTELATQIYG